jgi:hypothetical protein
MATNDITGDKLVNKKNTDVYRRKYAEIFTKGRSKKHEDKWHITTVNGVTRYRPKL